LGRWVTDRRSGGGVKEKKRFLNKGHIILLGHEKLEVNTKQSLNVPTEVILFNSHNPEIIRCDTITKKVPEPKISMAKSTVKDSSF